MILLMGSTGFLGKRTAKYLDKNKIPYITASLSLGTDFRNRGEFEKLFTDNKIEYILNAAAYVGGIHFGLKHMAELYHNNSLIITNLFELAHKYNIKRIVNPIANCSYPADVTGSFTEDMWWQGELHESVFVYGFIRKASYVAAWGYQHQYGMETINLIVPNMYGPEDHFEPERSHALGGMIMRMDEAIKNNDPEFVIWGTGSPVREWLYIDDCAEAMYRSLAIEYTSKPINIGIGSGVSILELAQLIKEEMGYTGKLSTDPSKMDGAPYKVMNTDFARQIFAWVPATSLAEGLKKTIADYLKNKRK